MPLRKQWRDLDRHTVARAPDRPGVYELADDDGTILAIDHGVLHDELKSAFAYGDAVSVRWETTHTLDQAQELATTHRDRHES